MDRAADYGREPRKEVGEVGAYDPEGQRLIVYGGRDYAASWDDPTYDDLHALSLGEGAATWSRLEASGQHPRLKSPRVVYDPQGRRLVFVELPNVFSLELGEQLSWHAFCQVGAPPALAVGDETSLALVPDGLFFAVGNASYRFDLTTPYCD